MWYAFTPSNSGTYVADTFGSNYDTTLYVGTPDGAGGMIVHPRGFLSRIRELCSKHDVFLILDEVMTAFGRTGTFFACEQEGVVPDLMALSKGLTGGYLPLAATLDPALAPDDGDFSPSVSTNIGPGGPGHRGNGPSTRSHGHGIGQAIRLHSDHLLKVETGSLYPALHRLVKRGWLKTEWGVSEANQRAKYYQLTAAGKAQLSREQDRWSLLVDAIGRVMKFA